MGLAQKRIIQEYQTTAYEEWKKKFDKAVGFKMDMEVRWDTMQSDDYQNRDQYFKWYEAVYFKPLLEVFSEICSDKMGKDAVKESVKKIVIDGTEGHGPHHSKFEKGVLTINHKFNTNVDSYSERFKGWKKLLEDKM